jgi:hypothetical protein
VRAFSSIPLAGLFVLVAAFNVWIMLTDHGPTPRRRRMWTQVDRVCVYTFIALFVIFCYFMLLRTRSAGELSLRVGLHLTLALILAPLLLIKVIVVRYQKSAWHVLMTLGGHDFCHALHAGVVSGGHDRISLWNEGSGFFRDVLKLRMDRCFR